MLVAGKVEKDMVVVVLHFGWFFILKTSFVGFVEDWFQEVSCVSLSAESFAQLFDG